MNQNTVSGDIIAFNLKQLGATDIKVFDSRMHIANFDLGNGLIVSYVFNITRHNKYFYSVCSHMQWSMVNSPVIRKLSILLQQT